MRIIGHRLAPLALFLLALVSLGVGLAELPVQDRDEARFAQASRQMADTLDLVDIRFQDAARHNKPALIYWLQTAALRLTGSEGSTPIWVHRLPSYLAAAFGALALVWAGLPVVGRRAALLAGLMLATVYMVGAEARTAKTDAALLLSVILVMGALVRCYLGLASRWLTPAIFWTALAAGFLVKGPVVLLPLAGGLVWLTIRDRRLGWMRSLRPMPGALWFAILVSPWFIAITLATDGAFWAASLGGDFSDKITGEGEHPGSPPGQYLITIWLTFWPWAVLLPLAAIHAWRNRADRKTAFLLGWLVPGWVVFEAVPVKLIHYTLPLYPALMLLAAAALEQVPFRRWPAWLGLAGFLPGLIFFPGVMVAAPVLYGDGADAVSILGAVALVAMAATGLWALWTQRFAGAVAALALSGAIMAGTLTAASLPAARQLWVSDRLAEAMASLPCLSGPLAIAGFAEPSTVFRLGTATRLTDLDGAMAWLAGGDGRAAWILSELPQDPPPEGIAGLTQVDAIGIGNFRPVSLRLFVSPGIPAPDAPCG